MSNVAHLAHQPHVSAFTETRITHFYVVETKWRCSCGAIIPGPVLNGIRVETESPSGNKQTFSLDRLLEFYKVLFPNTDPMTLLPALPVEHKTVILEANHCAQCIPLELGIDGNTNRMPVDLYTKSGPIESPNSPEAMIVNANAVRKAQEKSSKRKSKSRKANPKHAMSKAEYERNKAIKQGGLAGLNALAGL